MLTKRVCSLFASVAVSGMATSAFSATTPEVGKTVTVKNDVVLESGTGKHPLGKGETVHQDEIVITSKSASAEIELLDKTKLAVGPEARIVLDKFVYDAGAAPGSISINLTKGAFRFITGLSPKTSYEIKTPTASMGVRGTVFDVFVAENGETAVLLHEGGVDVCATPASCRRLDKKGSLVHVDLARVITAPLRWDGTLMQGVAAATAFPFLGKRLVIDPVRRIGNATIFNRRVMKGAGNVVTRPAKAIRRAIRRPKIRF